MKNLRIKSFGVGEMLVSNSFLVPPYQRSYAWTKIQVENLLTDLNGAKKRMEAGKDESYFLGSIVVVERKGSKSLEVVDGQQRLATVSIIIAAIRDYHIEIGQVKAAEAYDQQYLRTLHVPSGKKVPKLRLNEVDDRCFLQSILELPAKRKPSKPSIGSHKRISEAYACAMTHVRSLASMKVVNRCSCRCLESWFGLTRRCATKPVAY